MYTEAERDALLQQLVEHARGDPAIDAAALVGSAARGSLDRWSDIDLALGVAEGSGVLEVAARWTRVVAGLRAVSDTLDLWAGTVLYRVFLLPSSLQVDVSFWPAGSLAPAAGQAFTLLFGRATPPTPSAPADLAGVAAWGWLYALHARSAIARGRNWQAVQMLDGLRGQIVSLSCSRYGLETHAGRGVDQLPGSVLTALADTLPAAVTGAALATTYVASVRLLSAEIEHLDPALAVRLSTPLAVLQETAAPTST